MAARLVPDSGSGISFSIKGSKVLTSKSAALSKNFHIDDRAGNNIRVRPRAPGLSSRDAIY